MQAIVGSRACGVNPDAASRADRRDYISVRRRDRQSCLAEDPTPQYPIEDVRATARNDKNVIR
jgi:hypothetical protein